MFGNPLLDSVTSELVHFGQQSEIRKSEIAERLVGTRTVGGHSLLRWHKYRAYCGLL